MTRPLHSHCLCGYKVKGNVLKYTGWLETCIWVKGNTKKSYSFEEGPKNVRSIRNFLKVFDMQISKFLSQEKIVHEN